MYWVNDDNWLINIILIVSIDYQNNNINNSYPKRFVYIFPPTFKVLPLAEISSYLPICLLFAVSKFRRISRWSFTLPAFKFIFLVRFLEILPRFLRWLVVSYTLNYLYFDLYFIKKPHEDYSIHVSKKVVAWKRQSLEKMGRST